LVIPDFQPDLMRTGQMEERCSMIRIGKRALPLLPHPHHLRKQAKFRLAAMRATAPATRLAEAQALIAREYGFADWAALQAEVRNRAGGRTRCASLRHADLHAQRFEMGLSDEDSGTHTPADFFRLGLMAQVGVIFAALTGMSLVLIAGDPPKNVLAIAWSLGKPLARLLHALL
jgi:hypothetical protein